MPAPLVLIARRRTLLTVSRRVGLTAAVLALAMLPLVAWTALKAWDQRWVYRFDYLEALNHVAWANAWVFWTLCIASITAFVAAFVYSYARLKTVEVRVGERLEIGDTYQMELARLRPPTEAGALAETLEGYPVRLPRGYGLGPYELERLYGVLEAPGDALALPPRDP